MHEHPSIHGPPSLPVMLRLEGRRCVIVGGGAVAARRAAALVECGAEVVVVAPSMDEMLDRLLIERRDRGYAASDLDGAFLVVIATDDPDLNHRVAADAKELEVLINRADDADAADAGDLTVMGHDRRGQLTVAVDTGRASAAASKAIRKELVDQLDPDWIALLDAARPWRSRLKAAALAPGERTARLRRLTDAAAMHILKDSGAAALGEHLQRVADGRSGSGGDSGAGETL
ncbi:MAG: NAD(P)-dependent oxidoreductase [Planctomycetota bacterium]